MPKASKKEAELPLQEAGPSGMDVEAGTLPDKPSFAPLSATDEKGNKIEFRRVRGGCKCSGLALRRPLAPSPLYPRPFQLSIYARCDAWPRRCLYLSTG